MRNSNDFGDQLTPLEEIVIEAAVSYRKHLAGQMEDPTERLATFGAIALYQYTLKQKILAHRKENQMLWQLIEPGDYH